MIKRGFASLAHGQIHYRTQGEGAPLLALHASPGSSKQLVKLIGDLAATRHIIAPDTAGNGDSEPLNLAQPSITDLAALLPALLDELELDCVDLYGSHTGAAIATELAIAAPARIRRVVLDGVQLLTPEMRAVFLERYAHPFPPDLDGAYLMRVFQFCRDQYMFYPWYDRTITAQRRGGLPDPRDLHAWLIEVLKASETYHLNYRAAFHWQAASRLPHLAHPTLVIAAENDPLAEETHQAAQYLPNGHFAALPRMDAPDFRAQRQAVIETFLASEAA